MERPELVFYVDLVLRRQDRAEYSQPEGRGEVTHGLRDSGGLAITGVGGTIDRIRADRAEDQPDTGTGHHHVDPLPVQATRDIGHLLGPEVETDCRQNAADQY